MKERPFSTNNGAYCHGKVGGDTRHQRATSTWPEILHSRRESACRLSHHGQLARHLEASPTVSPWRVGNSRLRDAKTPITNTIRPSKYKNVHFSTKHRPHLHGEVEKLNTHHYQAAIPDTEIRHPRLKSSFRFSHFRASWETPGRVRVSMAMRKLGHPRRENRR